jgi:hypothetical protein
MGYGYWLGHRDLQWDMKVSCWTSWLTVGYVNWVSNLDLQWDKKKSELVIIWKVSWSSWATAGYWKWLCSSWLTVVYAKWVGLSHWNTVSELSSFRTRKHCSPYECFFYVILFPRWKIHYKVNIISWTWYHLNYFLMLPLSNKESFAVMLVGCTLSQYLNSRDRWRQKALLFRI